MTFAQTRVRRTVIGNMVMEIWTATFTGVESGNLATGLNSIEQVFVQGDTIRASMTVDHTTTAGTVAIAAVTADDVATVTVMGRSKA